ncbi:hypothetical protein OPQ81_000459 [Rhizoctonia solani]|nr:hypothetical protein OPQ81_000459 [Rhizoctonia solani]
MNLTGELRTPHFASDKYPEHWGPFELHIMVPYGRGLPALEVTHYQIAIEYKPANKSVIVGFDDFAPAWPMDRDENLSPKAIKRRDKYREMAIFRALVKIKKVKHLSLEGVERLRDAGADVSEEACKQGLWIAVYGKYYNFPIYQPGEKTKQLIRVQVFHEAEDTNERHLFIASMDPRTAVRSFLYFERIKLLHFIKKASKEDDGRTHVRDRSIEWFVQKMMEMYRFDETSVPEKRDNYRGARRHTSEARHVFVCHAEWLLEHTNIYQGPEKHMSKRVLKEWAALAPQMREIAGKEERAGWGVWDAVWDNTDFNEWYNKERSKFNYYLKLIRFDKEDTDGSTCSSSRTRRSGTKPTALDKGKGRAITVDQESCAYSWIPDPCSSDEEDDAGVSLDEDEWAGRAKRPRISSSQDGGAGPSGTQWNRSSPSLGSSRQGTHISSPLSRGRYQASPSLGVRTPSSGQHPTATSHFPGSARGAFVPTPSSSSNNPSSNWIFTSQKGPSTNTPPTSRRSLETRLSQLSTQTRPKVFEAQDVIYVSSDDDNNPMVASDVARSSIALESEIIEIVDSPSEDHDEVMRTASEIDEVEDALTQVEDDCDESPNPRQRTSVLRETVIGETPPRGFRSQLSSYRPDSPPVEVISDSQEEFNSSDSESKYSQPVPRPLGPSGQRTKRLQQINEQIMLFAPMAHSTVYAPQTWKPWKCNYPNQALKPGCDLKLARTIPCMFQIDLRHPSLEVQRLLNQDPSDAEFLKHLLTDPCVFKGPTDELPVAIITRVVELHREEHFRQWGVRRVITEANGMYRAHFEPFG